MKQVFLRIVVAIGFLAIAGLPISNKVAAQDIIGGSNVSTQDAHYQAGAVQGIIGGSNISIQDAPYQASIYEPDYGAINFYGSGVIISEYWILTTASFVHENTGKIHQGRLYVRVGSEYSNQGGQTRKVDAYVIHENFAPPTSYYSYENDIALLHLETPLTFDNSIQPIEWATKSNTSASDITPFSSVLITGWGSSNLQSKNMPIITNQDAMALNISSNPNNNRTITNGMISLCSTFGNATWHDQGGPAVIQKNGKKILVGLASWTYDRYNALLPFIYTNVREYADWIANHITFTYVNGVDLYAKDKPEDEGFEPNNPDCIWCTEDIWVRNEPDGGSEHQNPVYLSNPNAYNYVYVRIRNRGKTAYTYTNNPPCLVKLYWRKAGGGASWPNDWNGVNKLTGNIPMGGEITPINLSAACIPELLPGGTGVLCFRWHVPDPDDYASHNLGDPLHFCLLARIDGCAEAPMTFPETEDVAKNTRENNNIVWKNISIVPYDPDKHGHLGVTILVSNPYSGDRIFDLKFLGEKPDKTVEGIPVPILRKEAEVFVTLNELLWEKWENAGLRGKDIKIDNHNRRVLIIGDDPVLYDIRLSPEDRGVINFKIHFLTDFASQPHEFTLDFVQTLSENNEVVGGNRLLIQRGEREKFKAYAGSNVTIRLSESVRLSAENILEAATYNWYDEEKRLLYTGQSFVVTPESTTVYTLEIISDRDGFKDYDAVKVNVLKSFITGIYPNPVSDGNDVQVNYCLENTVKSAELRITSLLNNIEKKYPLEFDAIQTKVDISSYPIGQYRVELFVNGAIVDVKSLIKY